MSEKLNKIPFRQQEGTFRYIVINDCYGGFDILGDIADLIAKKKNIKKEDYSCLAWQDINRADADFVEAIRELGYENISVGHTKLALVEGLKDNRYIITDYDGWESVTFRGEIEWCVL